MKVAIYARVSTSIHGQNPDVQLEELRMFCKARGWLITEEIVDHGFSGKFGAEKRPGLKRLFELIRGRKVDGVAVIKLDRLFRSLKHLVNALDEFESLGIKFVAVKDNLDFTTPTGRLLVGLLAVLSQFEKELLVERTLAGLAHAKRMGKQLGRKREHDYERIQELRRNGLSYRQIQKSISVSMGTIRTALQQGAQKTPSKSSAESTDNTGLENQ